MKNSNYSFAKSRFVHKTICFVFRGQRGALRDELKQRCEGHYLKYLTQLSLYLFSKKSYTTSFETEVFVKYSLRHFEVFW